ncbi:MAG: hypothetical protein WBO29_03090, partial [Albidovulum sp.]
NSLHIPCTQGNLSAKTEAPDAAHRDATPILWQLRLQTQSPGGGESQKQPYSGPGKAKII